MTFLPLIREAAYRGGYRIHLVFNDGATGTISLRRWLVGPVLEPLRHLDQFRRFFADAGAVVWPSGADIAPETLHAAVVVRARPNGRLQLSRRFELKYPRLHEVQIRQVFCAPGWARN